MLHIPELQHDPNYILSGTGRFSVNDSSVVHLAREVLVL
jgi:hypothetical protein